MALAKDRLYTTEDIYALPDGQRAELIDGSMYLMAHPKRIHQKFVHFLDVTIDNYIREKGGDCEVYPAPFAVFLSKDDRNYVEPDISVVCDRGKLTEDGCSGAPDWIVEVVSPGSRRIDYYMKLFKQKRLENHWQRKYRDISLMYNLFTIKTNIFMSVMGLLVQMVSFLYCLWLLWTGTITYGTMTLFLTQRSNLSSAFNSVIGIIPSFLSSSVSAHRIRELVELPKEIHIPESTWIDQFPEQGYLIEMDAVNFAYQENNKVIMDSDFVANPGEIVALVGPSGEGKTTMIRLILGLIRPQDGIVKIKAVNGEYIEANADTRHLFAYVPQGNTILSGTIAENMRMVKEDATDEEIIEALKIGCAWDFVQKLPDGINSIVRERGRGLSEGQAQRIAISRAILRDAPILLLDEATSALDVTTERQVLRNIVQQRPNKTCIVTTHRPSVLNLCQRVYRVVEAQITELDEEESSRMAMDF